MEEKAKRNSIWRLTFLNRFDAVVRVCISVITLETNRFRKRKSLARNVKNPLPDEPGEGADAL